MIVLATVLLLGCVSSGGAAPETTTTAVDEAVACTTDADCEEGRFCAKEPGECDGDGECVPRPQICTADYSPVCGCDGKTYSNACNAAAKGQNVEHEGECDDEDDEGQSPS